MQAGLTCTHHLACSALPHCPARLLVVRSSSSSADVCSFWQAPKEKKAKRPAPSAAPRAPKAAKATANGNADEGGGKKKRKKKDPNAPKGALSAFMYFSNATRDQVRCLRLAHAKLHSASDLMICSVSGNLLMAAMQWLLLLLQPTHDT